VEETPPPRFDQRLRGPPVRRRESSLRNFSHVSSGLSTPMPRLSIWPDDGVGPVQRFERLR
jgi:hypothetical protein